MQFSVEVYGKDYFRDVQKSLCHLDILIFVLFLTFRADKPNYRVSSVATHLLRYLVEQVLLHNNIILHPKQT